MNIYTLKSSVNKYEGVCFNEKYNGSSWRHRSGRSTIGILRRGIFCKEPHAFGISRSKGMTIKFKGEDISW